VNEAAHEAFVRTFADQCRAVHRMIREQVSGLDAAALAWTPATETNSIAVLVTHVIGSEIEAVRTLAGLPSDRVRSKEFEVRGADAAALLKLVDRADAALDELTPAIDAARLAAEHVRPASQDKTPRPGMFVLMQTLGHAREHVGQMMLTRQLALERA
jgi:hypothetical protein